VRGQRFFAESIRYWYAGGPKPVIDDMDADTQLAQLKKSEDQLVAYLGEEKIPVTLAISLHAARDELRDVLVPINRKYPVRDLVDAAQAYGDRTGRRVSYEWVMLAGVNDTERDAKELGALLAGRLAHVNLIPFNPVDDTPFHAPERKSIRTFKEMVQAQGLNVTVRDTRGREADAACGQLHERVMRGRQAVEA